MNDEHAPAGDDTPDLETRVDDLFSDFGAYVGEPGNRRNAVRRLIHGAGINHADVDLLLWYFEHVEGQGNLNHMGGFVVSKLSDTESARDTLRGAKKVRERLQKKGERGRVNQTYGRQPKDVDTARVLAEKDLAMAVCYHVLDLEWDVDKAAEYHGIESVRVRDIVKDCTSENGRFKYVRQKDRPNWMKYACWVDGRKPIPREESQDPRVQPRLPALKKGLGLDDDNDPGPVFGEESR